MVAAVRPRVRRRRRRPSPLVEAALLGPRVERLPALIDAVVALAEAEEAFVARRGERRLPRARRHAVEVIDARFDAQGRAAQSMRHMYATTAAFHRQIDALGRGRRGGDAQVVAPWIERGVERVVAGVDDVVEEDLAAGPADRAVAVAGALAGGGEDDASARVLDGEAVGRAGDVDGDGAVRQRPRRGGAAAAAGTAAAARKPTTRRESSARAMIGGCVPSCKRCCSWR